MSCEKCVLCCLLMRVQQCVCGDVGREVIRLTHFQGDLTKGQGPYLLLTPYTHGVLHVDCEGPCADPNQSPAATRKKGPRSLPAYIISYI
jgi:hypothetical protein